MHWAAAGVAPCREQWECAVPEGAMAAQGQALRKGWECSPGAQESRAGAVSGSPLGPTVHVIVTRDVAQRSPIFNRTSMSQICLNHLFK